MGVSIIKVTNFLRREMIVVETIKIERFTLFSKRKFERERVMCDYAWELEQYQQLLEQGIQAAHKRVEVSKKPGWKLLFGA